MKALSELVLTFNPIGNPYGRNKAPVPFWDSSYVTNDRFWCIMFGEDPVKAGAQWNRLDLFDTRKLRSPNPNGIAYERIAEHIYVELNRTHFSSYLKLFHKMSGTYSYKYWLDLHQTEFMNSTDNCMIYLPARNMDEGEIGEENIRWAVEISEGWRKAGYRVRRPFPLPYNGTQAEYFIQTWKHLHKLVHMINVEVKNNAPDATAEFQKGLIVSAIVSSINRLL